MGQSLKILLSADGSPLSAAAIAQGVALAKSEERLATLPQPTDGTFSDLRVAST